MKRSVWICRDRCGDKSHQLFTSEPTDELGEWYSYIGAGSRPGRPANIYLPRSVALFLTGCPLAPGDKVEIPLEAAIESLREPQSFRPTRPVRQSA
jgi:hypothetical protein